MRISQKIVVGASITVLALGLVALSNFGHQDLPVPKAMGTIGVPSDMDLSQKELSEASREAGKKAESTQSMGNAMALDAMAGSQRLIRTGAITLEVKAFDAALGRLQQIAAEQGGYLADLRANRKEAGQAQGSVVIRVSPARYFIALDQLRQLGKVESEAIQTQDVTRAYADLESRLHNKRDLELRMREILRTRTSKLSDLLEAEKQLSQVTEEIERMEGERRYYQQMTGFSTVTLEMHEPFIQVNAAPQAPPLWAPVREAYHQSVTALIQAAALGVSALVFLLPWALLGWLGWIIAKKVLAHRRPVPSVD